MRISSSFDAGAIDVLSADHPAQIRLGIRNDSHAEFRQWFYFRVQGAAGTPLTMALGNAGQCSYADGWHGYQAVASYNRRDWWRVPTTDYDGQTLTIRHTPERDSIYYAYFEPYSWERHLDLLGQCDDMPWARVQNLGATVEGRDLDVVEVGSGARPVWVVARQHPGETMAEWLVEGLLQRLLDAADPVSRQLRRHCRFYIVPNINPDGAIRGNLRSNAAGANLNREWHNPSLERSPEVLWVRNRMQQTGVGAFFDIHGDETLPYVFVDGNDMLPGFTQTQVRQEHVFKRALLHASPDFQIEQGYARDRFTDELLTLASKWVGHTFGCLSLTLEMPFKDNANLPDAVTGWNGARSKKLGAAMLDAMLRTLV